MNDFIHNNILFIILLSGHLTGDFIFQSGSLYGLKINSLKGQILHAAINGITILGILILSYTDVYLIIISSITVFFTHFIIDYIKIQICRKNPLLFIMDQCLHIIVLLLLVLLFRNTVPRLFITSIYRYFIVFNILIIVTMLIKHFTMTIYYYFRIRTMENRFYTYLEYMEKALIMYFAYMHGFFFILIPLVLIPRLIIAFREESEYFLIDILTSMIVSALGGIVLRQIVFSSPVNTGIFIIMIISVLFITFIFDIITSRLISEY